MLKIFSFYFSLLCFILSLAQEKVDIGVSYKLTYRIDTTAPKPEIENFVLHANAQRSIFRSASVYIRDSLLSAQNPDLKMIAMKYKTPNDYYIIVDQSAKKIKHFQPIQDAFFFYDEPIKMNWKIENETKSILGKVCRKATTNAFGRTWIAWYSDEYPVQFGPYKFSGLPGLILEIYDTKNHYSFTATHIKAKKDKLISFDLDRKYIKTTKEKFWKSYTEKKYEISPVFDGLVFEDPNVIPTMKKNMEAQKKRESNPVELIH